MTDSQLQRWKRVQSYPFDRAGARVTFAQRVAKKQDWTAAFAARAIEEYRRFAFIAAVSGHPVSPPRAVDEVWHEHLQFTRSYWESFCKGTLEFALHHEPGMGAPGERDTFAQWYALTLASYREIFEMEPPADIWPGTPARTNAPKRRWSRSGAPWWRLSLLGAMAAALAAAGCASSLVHRVNPLDLRGPEFLWFFAEFAGSCLAVALCLDWCLRGGGLSAGDFEPKNPYAFGLLANGRRGAMQACVATLYFTRVIRVNVTSRRISAIKFRADGLSAVDEAVLRYIRGKGDVTLSALCKQADIIFADALRELAAAGYGMSADRARRLQWLGAIISTIPICLGGAKVAVGISRHRPVAFLIVLMFICAMITVGIWHRPRFWTRAGKRWIRRKKAEFEWPPGECTPHDVAVGVGLLGIPAVQYLGLDALAALLVPPASTADGGGASSCGGGGGGGGGGGCGGCSGH